MAHEPRSPRPRPPDRIARASRSACAGRSSHGHARTANREPTPDTATERPGPAAAARGGGIRAYGWEWGREEDRRPRLPWIGIFLIVYGALLLVDRLAPQYLRAGNLLVLAAGPRVPDRVAAPARHVRAVRRRVPDRLRGAGPDQEPRLRPRAPGFGTLCYGVAFLFIAARPGVARRRASAGRRVIGVLLVALGGSELALPDAASLVLPVLLVAFGLVLLTRAGAS